jgi:hypothetical protein
MESRFYQSSELDIERVAYEVEDVFRAQGNQVQHFGNAEQTVVQIRQGGEFEAIIGMQAALTVTLQKSSGGVVVTVGQQQWVDKAVIGAVGMFFLWPLILTAGAGLFRQLSLETQLLNAVDIAIRRQRANVAYGPVPPNMQGQQAGPAPQWRAPWQSAAPAQVPCANCKEVNEQGDIYCSHCGKPLTPQKKVCPQCHAETKPNAEFCTKCGTAFAS